MQLPNATLRVRLTPRAGRNQLLRWEAGVLHARVCAPPVDGAANAALIELLARTLDVPKSRITILSGESSRDKKLGIATASQETVDRMLSALETGGNTK